MKWEAHILGIPELDIKLVAAELLVIAQQRRAFAYAHPNRAETRTAQILADRVAATA